MIITMKRLISNILYIGMALSLLFVSCSDDHEMVEQELQFCVKAAWENGFAHSRTRGLSHSDLFASGNSDLQIDINDYPERITMSCTDGKDYILRKGSGNCAKHGEYWDYITDALYHDQEVIARNLTFTATATIDGGDELKCVATKSDIKDYHLLFTLHHTKALLRFAFKVDEKYDKLRYIKVTNINVNGSDATLKDVVLSKDVSQFIAYAYVNPEVVTTKSDITLQCRYDIYDKDADFVTPGADNSTHITRKDVTATNTFKLGSLKDALDNAVSTIQAGYYYDIKVTLNPGYLYVLSEHDEEHLTVK